ncbi:MAG TPA: SMC-Scp complex subunit ScpB [Acidobacteriaceae bacterium]|nr:SMC-Scp complex subunit ScpB [Acidobacteriaceae bacterium]
MSLKARIEAVIYAAEEPVTLAQLASLFRDEALALRAARSNASADPEAPAESDVPMVSDLVPTGKEAPRPSEDSAQNSADAEVATVDFAGDPQPAPDPPGTAVNQIAPEQEASDESVSLEAAAEAEKKAARQRDREVRDEIRRVIDELIDDYNAADSGLEIREVAGGYRFGTRPEYHDAVRAFIKTLRPPFKLSMQALETLAVIAYKQPITAPEIGEIRGVDSSGVLGSLVARKLITTAGRKQVLGRPILYKTTKEFLVRFGLKDVNELPSLEEFEKMASELAETEAEGAIAPGEEELPFAQNEMAEIEEASSSDVEANSVSARDPHDPNAPAPPMNDPEPEEPEPPISDPPAEPEPAPTTEMDAAEHAEKAHR